MITVDTFRSVAFVSRTTGMVAAFAATIWYNASLSMWVAVAVGIGCLLIEDDDSHPLRMRTVFVRAAFGGACGTVIGYTNSHDYPRWTLMAGVLAALGMLLEIWRPRYGH